MASCGSQRTGGMGLVDVAVPALLVSGNQLYGRRSSLYRRRNSYSRKSNKTYRRRSNKTYRRRRS